MDLRLPDMDGTDAARKLARRGANGADPGRRAERAAARGRRRLARAAGFAGCLEKPISVARVPGPGAPLLHEQRRVTPSLRGGACTVLAPRRTAGGHGWHARVLLLTSAALTLDGSAPACEHRHVPVARRARTERRLTSMRTLLIGGALAVIVVSLAACGGSSTSSASEEALQRQADLWEIDQIEKNFHKATSKQDIDLMMSLWAPNATFTTVPGETATGTKEIRQLLARRVGGVQARESLGLGHPRVQGPDHGQRRQGHAELRVPLRRHQDGQGRAVTRPPIRRSRGSTDAG